MKKDYKINKSGGSLFMKTNTNKLLAILLAFVTIVGVLPISGFAATATSTPTPSSTSNVGTITDRYIDEVNGSEIATQQAAPATEAKTPQSVAGYEYTNSYSQNTDNIYDKEDITYIIGYPDKTVQGDRYLSRAEAATIFYRLYDGEYPQAQRQMTSTTFSDVPQDAWYYTELALCYNVGLVNGDDDGTFQPDAPITRAEFATIAAKFANLANSDKQMFNDVTADNWAYLAINAAATAGWIQGYDDGTFKPDADISRSETATLVNHMLNHAVTVDQLKELGVVNPYTDLVETYWAYADLIEATVKHSAAEWNDVTYNGGKINTIIEKYVDKQGNEIAPQTVTQSEVNNSPTQIDKYYYVGYVTTITYVYNSGAADMTGTKSVDKSTAKVGDTLTYTITASNADTATEDLKNVVMNDAIPAYLDFTQGSVQVDGSTAQYSYDESAKQLSVQLGEIAPGQTETVTFDAVVNNTAFNQSFKNTAVLSADNNDDVTVSDNGVAVNDGTAYMSATKSVDKSTAKVGDTLTYTITATNDKSATVNLQNVVMNDTISEYLSFGYGSVQVDGYSANYSYDNASRQLSVKLGDIAPGQTKTITFAATVNSTAYGQKFTNTAVLSADNDDNKTATDNGVTIADGTPEGSVGTKTVSQSTAKVGDTLTYTITLRNASTATADWTNVDVADPIPQYLNFVSGSVEEDGRASTNTSYDASTNTLSLFADSIAIGETKTFTFKATVQDGAQGMYIVNTANVSSDGRENMQLPDTGVQIDAGNTDPSMTKTASTAEAHAGDIYTYTVTMKNGNDATAAWKNVVMSDVLPSGVKLVSGSVTLNGKTNIYGISGQAITVNVGDLAPNTEAVITFDVRVLDNAVGTTVQNVATADGDNGQATATDNGVTVPNPPTPAPTNPADGSSPIPSVTGTKTVDKTLVNPGDKVTYTITATNNTDQTWTGVQAYDVLDTSALTLINDTIYIDGIRYLMDSGKWSFTDMQLVLNLGDIAPGQTVQCEFAVQFKNDAVNSTYVNHATIKGTNNDTVYVQAPEVDIMGGDNNTYFTDIHYKLFNGLANDDGSPNYLWEPDSDMEINYMCMVGYRLMTDYYRSSLGNGTITVPNTVPFQEVAFFISHGVISASEYTSGAMATQSQIYRILNYAIGANLSSDSTSLMTRASVASLICQLTGRDTNPNTNGLPLAYFSDKGSYASLIDEVSNSHDYTIDSSGHETWISILQD